MRRVCGLTIVLVTAAAALSVAPCLAEGHSQFALGLFRAVAARERGNVCFSPLSLELALGMAAGGARGETFAQLARVLGTAAREPQALLQGYGLRLDALARAAGTAELLVATSLWKRRGTPFRRNFTDACSRFFQATAMETAFGSGEGQRRINGWISGRTRGRIPALFAKPLDPLTRLVLVSALHFSGGWEKPFRKSRTAPASFYVRPDRPVSHPLMSATERFRYAQDGEKQALLLGYRESSLAMLILLPRRGGLEALLAGLTPAGLRQTLAALVPQRGRVELPQFRIGAGTQSMSGHLRRLGLSLPFDADRADFTLMSAEKTLHIMDVLHQAAVAVDEAGTTATAAGTVITGVRNGESSGSAFHFRADRPFMFFILDRKAGTILFAGLVRDPSR